MSGVNVPSFRHLRIFATVARCESISRASTQINLSQPALTQAIAKLEADVGARLFERRNTGCYLTEFGKIFERRATRLFTQIEQALVQFGISLPRSDRAVLQSIESRITRPQIRSLLAISDTGSFASAARALDISEASLNRAAHDFERTLRRPLFHRTAYGMTTTRAAAELARRLRLAIHEIELAVDELEAAKGVSRGRIGIGTLPLAGSFFIAQALRDLTEAYPDIHIEVVDGAYDMLLARLRSGTIDFILGPVRQPDPELGVTEHPLFFDQYSIVVRRGHPLTKKRRIDPDDLASFDWVIPPAGVPRWQAFDRLFAAAKRKPRHTIQTSSLGIIRAILAETDRLSLLSRYEVESEEKLGFLTTLPCDVADIGRTVQVTTRSDWLPTAVQLRFMELLKENAARLGQGGERQ